MEGEALPDGGRCGKPLLLPRLGGVQAGGAGGLGRQGRGGGRGITCRKEKKGHVAGGAGEKGFHRPWAPATVQAVAAAVLSASS